MLKKVIAVTEIAPNFKQAEMFMEEVKDRPGYVSAYTTGFLGDPEFAVVVMYEPDSKDATQAHIYKEAYINV